MTDLANDDRREILYEVREKMDECAQALRSLHDERINVTCLAAFEGKAGGWLGEFERDIIEQAITALDEGDDDSGDD